MEAYTKLIWGTLAPPQVHLQCVDDGNGPTRNSLLHGTIIRIPPGICLHACINALDPPQYISQTGHRAHCSRTSVDRRCILWAHIGQTCRQCCLCVEHNWLCKQHGWASRPSHGRTVEPNLDKACQNPAPTSSMLWEGMPLAEDLEDAIIQLHAIASCLQRLMCKTAAFKGPV